MVASSLRALRPSVVLTRARGMAKAAPKEGELPMYDPAAAIPMKWGAVYMGAFMGFWFLCFAVNPYLDRSTMTSTFEKKWQGK